VADCDAVEPTSAADDCCRVVVSGAGNGDLIAMSVAIDGDPTLPDREGLVRKLTDPDGMYGMPAEAVPDILVTGGPAAIAERITAFRAIGAERVVVTLAAGNWAHQAELLAEATALAD
jgi:hypothetical protein